MKKEAIEGFTTEFYTGYSLEWKVAHSYEGYEHAYENGNFVYDEDGHAVYNKYNHSQTYDGRYPLGVRVEFYKERP